VEITHIVAIAVKVYLVILKRSINCTGYVASNELQQSGEDEMREEVIVDYFKALPRRAEGN
jgi:hypothetical protein